MRSRLYNPEWHAALAALIRDEDAAGAAQALSDLIGQTVRHEGTCLLAFHRDAPPEVLHHTLDAAGARHYLDRYLAGPYLLDPLYLLAMRSDKPSLCRFRDQSPDRFRASEYYRQYCEQTHLQDEMDFLVEVSERSTLAMVVGRRTGRFSKAELERIRLIEDIVTAAMHRIWRCRDADEQGFGQDEELHRHLLRCFEEFGDGRLTGRERQITQLLLRGHSAKSIARELGIAPGTVMVHKRNLFAKLGITSQFGLFSLFIDSLSQR